MRVQYTLPGYQPALKPLPSAEDAAAVSTFRNRIRSSQWQGATSWKRVLKVDSVAFSATLIGPPPRPMSLESEGLQTERQRWQRLLDRHANVVPVESNRESLDKVSAMMFLIVRVQTETDAVTARSFQG